MVYIHLSLYGFLRVSEYTYLCWCDVTFAINHLSIILHQSKTDPFQLDCTVKILKTISSTCPFHSFEVCHKLSGIVTPTTPLFQAGRFHPLSHAAVTKTLCKLLHQAGLNESQFASHSFRISTATTAAAAGLPAWLIKSLGCWSNNAYLSSIIINIQDL